jgi:salicylate hydroxylase
VSKVQFPVLPHMGQGASQGIEDAEALGAFLRAASTSEVPEALHHVFRVRYRRASRMQAASRAGGISKREYKQGGTMSPADGMREIAAGWMYDGSEKWEKERPEMVLSKKEEATLLSTATSE